MLLDRVVEKSKSRVKHPYFLTFRPSDHLTTHPIRVIIQLNPIEEAP
jgi:hypothetical protein